MGDCLGLLPELMIAEDFGGFRLLLDPCNPVLELNASKNKFI